MFASGSSCHYLLTCELNCRCPDNTDGSCSKEQVHVPHILSSPLPLVDGGLQGRLKCLKTIIKNRVWNKVTHVFYKTCGRTCDVWGESYLGLNGKRRHTWIASLAMLRWSPVFIFTELYFIERGTAEQFWQCCGRQVIRDGCWGMVGVVQCMLGCWFLCSDIWLPSECWQDQASPVSMLCRNCFPSPLIG